MLSVHHPAVSPWTCILVSLGTYDKLSLDATEALAVACLYSTEVSYTTSYGGGYFSSSPSMKLLQLTLSPRITGGWDRDADSWGLGLMCRTTHGIATGFYCNVNANDMGQVWGRHLMAWAQVQVNICNSCNGACTTHYVGWVDSPAGGDRRLATIWLLDCERRVAPTMQLDSDPYRVT